MKLSYSDANVLRLLNNKQSYIPYITLFTRCDRSSGGNFAHDTLKYLIDNNLIKQMDTKEYLKIASNLQIQSGSNDYIDYTDYHRKNMLFKITYLGELAIIEYDSKRRII